MPTTAKGAKGMRKSNSIHCKNREGEGTGEEKGNRWTKEEETDEK